MFKPIHQLFVDNGVNIFFQGHDHLFAREVKDGVIYQEIPMPSDSTYEIGMLANADAYLSDTIGGSGHLNVSVTPSCVTVDFVRTYLPADTLTGLHHNREIAFSYNIGNCATAINESIVESNIKVFPNPAKDKLTVAIPESVENLQISLINTLGQTILKDLTQNIDVTKVPNGIYFLNIKTETSEVNKKVIIC